MMNRGYENTMATGAGTQNKDWWPKQLNLDILRQHDIKSNPLVGFDYKKEVMKLDYEGVKNDVKEVMKNSQDCLLYTSPSPRD